MFDPNSLLSKVEDWYDNYYIYIVIGVLVMILLVIVLLLLYFGIRFGIGEVTK